MSVRDRRRGRPIRPRTVGTRGRRYARRAHSRRLRWQPCSSEVRFGVSAIAWVAMPITYEVDPEQNLIYERWSGYVNARALGEHWHQYLVDPAVIACRRTLVDLRDAHIDFTGSELRHLVRTLVEPVLAGRAWTTALLVGRPSQRGSAHQYQVYAESYSEDAIFEDEDEALTWLREQPRHP